MYRLCIYIYIEREITYMYTHAYTDTYIHVHVYMAYPYSVPFCAHRPPPRPLCGPTGSIPISPPSRPRWAIRDFKDTVDPLFESDTLFLECCSGLLLAVQRFFESRDV